MSAKKTTPEICVVMQRALSAKPSSYAELMELTGLPQRSVARWVTRMRGANEVYVSGWGPDRRGRIFVALYAWGKGADAPMPGPVMTNAARMRALRQRKQATDPKPDGRTLRKKKPPVSAGIGIDDLI